MMKIMAQYAEMANIQRSARKDDNQRIKEDNSTGQSVPPRATGDVAELSEGARRMSEVRQMVNKIHDLPDNREAKVEEVISRLRQGVLISPDAVKDSISKMLDTGMVL